MVPMLPVPIDEPTEEPGRPEYVKVGKMPLLKEMDMLVLFWGIPVPVPMIALADTEENEYGPRPSLALGSVELAVADRVTLIVEVKDALRDIGPNPLLGPAAEGEVTIGGKL